VLTRFGRNQHQILVRRLLHITQTTTVEDYVRRFFQLMDQIAAYEVKPDPVHYTTKFLDGLKSAVRVLVAIQQPPDLDTAYSLALLYEELGEGPTSAAPGFSPSPSPFLRSHQLYTPIPPPPPPSKWVSRSAEQQCPASDDKWSTLKAYRRSKGLCFTCGEKWGQYHQCKPSIQLHVVRAMIDYMQCSDANDTEESDPKQQEPQITQHLLLPSAAAVSSHLVGQHTLQLQVEI
jgi:hypothetical protein